MSHNEACYCLRNGATKFCDNCPTHRGGAAPPRPDEAYSWPWPNEWPEQVRQAAEALYTCRFHRSGARLARIDKLVQAALAASEQQARTEALAAAVMEIEKRLAYLGRTGGLTRMDEAHECLNLVRALSGRPAPTEGSQ